MAELTPLRAAPPDPKACWMLVERISNSPQLRRAVRLRELFLYICRGAVLKGSSEIHEQEIGCAVFDRPEAYDTNIDNIVRTSMSELRKRLEAYFESEAGKQEPLMMAIPRGCYVPAFFQATANKESDNTASAIPVQRSRHWTLLMTGIVTGVFILGGLTGWFCNRELMQHILHPWHSSPAVADLWSGFLDSRQNTDVVTADTSFLLVQASDNHAFSFNEYFSRSYVSQVLDQKLSPEMHSVLRMIASKNLGSSGEFKLAQRIIALDPTNKNIHIYNAREYMPALSKQDNVILLGSRISNPWDYLFDDKLNFKLNSDRVDFTVVTNHKPLAGEQAVYTPTDNIGYCVVGYLPNADGHSKVLLIEGTSSEAVEAAGDFLLSEGQLTAFRRKLNRNSFPYFEVLLRTSQVRGTPLEVETLAYRIYPDLR